MKFKSKIHQTITALMVCGVVFGCSRTERVETIVAISSAMTEEKLRDAVMEPYSGEQVLLRDSMTGVKGEKNLLFGDADLVILAREIQQASEIAGPSKWRISIMSTSKETNSAQKNKINKIIERVEGECEIGCDALRTSIS